MLFKIRPFVILDFELQVSMNKLAFVIFLTFSVFSSTIAQVTLVKDLNTKADSSFSSFPEFITAVGTKIVYAAEDASAGHELWVSDGTKAGTLLLKDINPTGDSNPSNPESYSDGMPAGEQQHFVELDGKILFVADDGTHGFELWI